MSNIPLSIKDKLNRKLFQVKNHPICIIKTKILEYFKKIDDFNIYENLNSTVTTEDNFDMLLIPPTHPSRSKSDTYYVDEHTVLRTHMTSHQHRLLKEGVRKALMVGDVYRKDEVDKTHYPVFHQMDGFTKVPNNKDPFEYLREIMSGLVNHLFPDCEYRINSDYFPFTNPSFEVEVMFNNKWLEILGCGVIHDTITSRHHIKEPMIAWGLGIERLCMILFDIPDIRLFWSSDEKFLNQWSDGLIKPFKPFTNYPDITQDISFWIEPEDVEQIENDNKVEYKWKHVNEFFEMIRELDDNFIEEVKLLDTYKNSKTNLLSNTYRLYFKPLVSISNPSEVQKLSLLYFKKITDKLTEQFNIKLR
jgi:phenylalanyl-tRNA synthetase alpha chain